MRTNFSRMFTLRTNERAEATLSCVATGIAIPRAPDPGLKLYGAMAGHNGTGSGLWRIGNDAARKVHGQHPGATLPDPGTAAYHGKRAFFAIDTNRKRKPCRLRRRPDQRQRTKRCPSRA